MPTGKYLSYRSRLKKIVWNAFLPIVHYFKWGSLSWLPSQWCLVDLSFFRLHYYGTTALSCQQDTMVPATIAHRKDLKEKIQKLRAGGTSELE